MNKKVSLEMFSMKFFIKDHLLFLLSLVMGILIIVSILFIEHNRSAHLKAFQENKYSEILALSNKKQAIIFDSLEFYKRALSLGEIDSAVYDSHRIYLESEAIYDHMIVRMAYELTYQPKADH